MNHPLNKCIFCDKDPLEGVHVHDLFSAPDNFSIPPCPHCNGFQIRVTVVFGVEKECVLPYAASFSFYCLVCGKTLALSAEQELNVRMLYSKIIDFWNEYCNYYNNNKRKGEWWDRPREKEAENDG